MCGRMAIGNKTAVLNAAIIRKSFDLLDLGICLIDVYDPDDRYGLSTRE
jgi:hypothetical protein